MWTSEVAGRRAELSCRRAEGGDGQKDAGAAPSPYATTALLQPGQSAMGSDYKSDWLGRQGRLQVRPPRGQTTGQTAGETGQTTGQTTGDQTIGQTTGGQTTGQAATETGQTTAQTAAETGQTTGQTAAETGQTAGQISAITGLYGLLNGSASRLGEREVPAWGSATSEGRNQPVAVCELNTL